MFTERADSRNFLISNPSPRPGPTVPSPSSWPTSCCPCISSDCSVRCPTGWWLHLGNGTGRSRWLASWDSSQRHRRQWDKPSLHHPVESRHVACSYGMNVFWINPYGKENKERENSINTRYLHCRNHSVLLKGIRNSPWLFWIFQLETNLRQESHEQLIHIMVDPHGSLNELAVVRRGHRFALWNWKTGGKIFLVKFPTMHFCCKSNSKVSNLTTPLWPVHIVAQNQHTPPWLCVKLSGQDFKYLFAEVSKLIEISFVLILCPPTTLQSRRAFSKINK